MIENIKYKLKTKYRGVLNINTKISYKGIPRFFIAEDLDKNIFLLSLIGVIYTESDHIIKFAVSKVCNNTKLIDKTNKDINYFVINNLYYAYQLDLDYDNFNVINEYSIEKTQIKFKKGNIYGIK